MQLNSKVIRKSLYQDVTGRRLKWRLFQVFFIKKLRVEFSVNFIGEAEVVLLEPLLRKTRVLATSTEGVTAWQAKDAFEEFVVFGPATIELNYSGRGDCRAFIELEVEIKEDQEEQEQQQEEASEE